MANFLLPRKMGKAIQDRIQWFKIADSLGSGPRSGASCDYIDNVENTDSKSDNPTPSNITHNFAAIED